MKQTKNRLLKLSFLFFLSMQLVVFVPLSAFANQIETSQTNQTVKTGETVADDSETTQETLLTEISTDNAESGSDSQSAVIEESNSDSNSVSTVNYASSDAIDSKSTIDEDASYAAGEVIVVFKDGVTEENAADVLSAATAVSSSELTTADVDAAAGVVVANVSDSSTVTEAVDELNSSDEVEYAQPNYIYTLESYDDEDINSEVASTSTNDPYINNQWALSSIGAFDAWDYAKCSKQVSVAILDTGIDTNHPDLVDNIDTTHVYDGYLNSNVLSQDIDGHGTHVAGIIAAEANNGVGVCGISYNANIIAINVFHYDQSKQGYVADTASLYNAYEYLLGADIDDLHVINMSLGGLGSTSKDGVLETEIDKAYAKNIVTVCAAGNDRSSDDYYPASYSTCVNVSALNSDASFASSYSNYGSTIDISAPGTSIYSTTNNDSYGYKQGTSMAAPAVSAVLALMFSADSNLSAAEAISTLYDTATDLGSSGRDDYYGYGEVNAAAAVKQIVKDATTLPAGDYYISTAANTQRVVDVSAGSLSDGANVQTWLSNTTGAQKWQVSVDEYGWATITNIGSGKVLDAAGANCAAGTNVWQYAANGTDAQKWSIEQQADGTWIIRSALSDSLVLDVASAVDADGTNLQIWTDNGTRAQRFVFTDCDTVVTAGSQTITPGAYVVHFSSDTDRCLDLSGASFGQGANLQIWSVNGTYAQMYQFIWDAQTGAYEIVVLSSGKVLGVSSASPLINGNVAQYSANGSLSQRWRADANGDGTYTFYNMATGKVLDIAGAVDADGTNVGTYASNGTGAQRFVLTSVDTLVEDGTYMLCSNLTSDRVVDVPAASTGVGVQLQIYSSNGTLAQRFSFTAQQDGSYHIRALNSGLLLADAGGGVVQTNVDDSSACWNISMAQGGMVLTNVSTGRVMDVTGASTTLGTSLQTYGSNGTLAQRFRLVEVDPLQSGAAYELAPASSSSLRADVAGGSRADGANLQVYTANDTNAQKFVFTKVGTHWRITGAKTGKAIDVLNADGSSGANVQMWYTNGSDAQLWDVTVDEAGDYVISNVISGTCLTVADPGNADGCNIAACALGSSVASEQAWRLISTSTSLSDYVVLSVPCYYQNPVLPTGCESVALTNALRYFGFNLGVATIASDYMPWGSGGDFVYAFMGNPFTDSGATIMPPGLVNTANAYLEDQGSTLRASDISGTSFYDLYSYVDAGYPVIVWNTMYMGELDIPEAWQDGYTAYRNTHTVVISGYNLDSNEVLVADSLSGIIWRDASDFAYIYWRMGSLAMVVH